MFRLLSFIMLLVALSGCGQWLQRLQNIGHVPPINVPDIPVYVPDVEFDGTTKSANSLWHPGSVSFFQHRTRSVGDIIRVNVEISDKAKMENETNRQRKSKESLSLPRLFGIQDKLIDNFSNAADKDPSKFLDLQSSNSNLGKGAIDRSETIHVQVAAIVSKILPNGNLVLEGNQEIRVNYEVRAVNLKGIIRPEDITADNTIETSKIAELRVSYGGRGHLSDFQQPRIGSQLVDIISPF